MSPGPGRVGRHLPLRQPEICARDASENADECAMQLPGSAADAREVRGDSYFSTTLLNRTSSYCCQAGLQTRSGTYRVTQVRRVMAREASGSRSRRSRCRPRSCESWTSSSSWRRSWRRSWRPVDFSTPTTGNGSSAPGRIGARRPSANWPKSGLIGPHATPKKTSDGTPGTSASRRYKSGNIDLYGTQDVDLAPDGSASLDPTRCAAPRGHARSHTRRESARQVIGIGPSHAASAGGCGDPRPARVRPMVPEFLDHRLLEPRVPGAHRAARPYVARTVDRISIAGSAELADLRYLRSTSSDGSSELLDTFEPW